MSYHFENGESIYQGTRRIAKEEAERAIENLNTTADIHEGLHEARKHFKRIRALIRFVRDDIPKDTYRLENRDYRDIGRKLSDLRDVTSCLEALDRLKDSGQDKASINILENFESQLKQRRETVTNEMVKNGVIENVISNIESAKTRIPEWQFLNRHKKIFSKSIPRVYKRGLKAFSDAYHQQTDDAFHEWRKRVKYLLYHTQLMRPFWDYIMKPYEKAVKSLSNFLGEDHDLFLIKQALQSGMVALSEAETKQIFDIVVTEQQSKRRDAYYLGKKVYAEHPEAFGSRIFYYFDTWKEELYARNT